MAKVLLVLHLTTLAKGAQAVQEPVLDCYWFEVDDLECAVHPDYEFNKVITDHMTVNISSASTDHEGRYKCQVVPPNDATACDLVLKHKTTTPRSTTDSRKKFTDAKTPRDTGPDLIVQTPRDPVLYVVAVAVLSLLMIVAAVVGIFAWRWFRRRKRRERMKNDYSLVPTHEMEPHRMTPRTQEISGRPNLPPEILTHPPDRSETPTTFTLTTGNRKHAYKVQMLNIFPSYGPIYSPDDDAMDPSWQYAPGASEDQVLELNAATFGD
ncbi:hypothetical protein BaRGS_00039490 [Batillaria attramentaria]|uniref:Ig-like domain-containing protein n=1 Tax=Batillaria attramentaria TaxID=370345 RepID=A0ABD0J2Z1_9CAEN